MVSARCGGCLPGRHLRLAAEMRPELVAGMGAREGRVRNGHVKETAERLPAVGDVEDKETVGGDDLPDAGVVRAVARDRAVAVGEIAEGARQDTRLHRRKDFSEFGRQWKGVHQGEELADGAVETGPPVVLGSFGMDYLRIWKGDGRFLPDRRARPIDLRFVACVDVGPVDLLTCEDRLPMRKLFLMGRDL